MSAFWHFRYIELLIVRGYTFYAYHMHPEVNWSLVVFSDKSYDLATVYIVVYLLIDILNILMLIFNY